MSFASVKKQTAAEMRRSELTACASAVQTAIIQAARYYQNKRFSWNEFSGVLKSTVASTTAVTLSVTSVTNIVRLDTVRVVIGSRDLPLRPMTWAQMDSIDAGQWYGYPEYYTIHSNELRLYPPPNAVYPMRWAGIKAIGKDLTATGSASGTFSAGSGWLEEGEELIRLKAKSLLFRDLLRSPEEAEYYQSAAERVYKELNREIIAKMTSGYVRPTKW